MLSGRGPIFKSSPPATRVVKAAVGCQPAPTTSQPAKQFVTLAQNVGMLAAAVAAAHALTGSFHRLQRNVGDLKKIQNKIMKKLRIDNE
mmetsp:Transcript_1296/g.2819  ORF Transcript_1296/g.2819 Transcript_1296/m.2819 type:complete len:89 (-) Transcript_1296:742-1008(-)|eukprot:CAMPEP_0202891234 /NCGR_PEP_ID=MMETSP1392-20130828/1349_1 /ASSEMBLY_ACC=CAM_ASM_000868 /TAXON_ID=225041 /ORGANISM="Chlamydomonas chlamydogama, Strain SAG 11-48b" /LENGTH=88 /DNA_ID=CAMNT_0049574925 /DNA_START=82 /DNA_END=348 /DNA_ORIENTATION=+